MPIKQKRPKKPALNLKDVEYVLYCRKSSEESSTEQQQSIIDQLKRCMVHADNIGINLMRRNQLFDDNFNDNAFLRRKAKQTNKHELEVLSKAEDLFYIVEEKSAKIPNNREKRTKLIKLVKAGKIKGILSYAPDRQARNLPEAGELVQLLDDGLLDVKYKNFTFENNPSGRMVLGITFVISYNYSDTLAQNIERGNIGALERGTALGKFKHGYIINDDKYHEPDPESFNLWRAAFDMKLEGKTDKEISEFLSASGYRRKYKNKDTDLNPKSIYKVWIDEFYYGKFICGKETIDLRDTNPHFKPLITEEEHTKLLIRYKSNNPISLRAVKPQDEYYDVKPFDNGLIVSEEGLKFSFNMPNRGRFDLKLLELKKTNPQATLKDVIFFNQIDYKSTVRDKDGKYQYVSASEIDEAVTKFLHEKMRLTQEIYDKYAKDQETRFDRKMHQTAEERTRLQLNRNNIDAKLNEFVRRNMAKQRSSVEQEVYDKELQKLQGLLDGIDNELNAISDIERSARLDADAFFTILREAPELYRNGTNVRKRKICNLLFSNIILTKEKALLVAPKLGLEELFFSIGGNIREDVEQLDKKISYISPKIAKEFVKFYFLLYPENINKYRGLTQKQRLFYGLKES